MTLSTASCSSTGASSATTAKDDILEVNVTRNPEREHGQPVVIANPKDPNNLVLLSINHRASASGAPDRFRCFVAYSTDRGVTWTEAAWPLGDRPMCGDPYLDVDSEGTFYMAFNRLGCNDGSGGIGTCNGMANPVAVARSRDGGRTWSAPVDTTVKRGTTPRLRVDAATGHIYAVGGVGEAAPHAVSVSSDHGLTFAPQSPLPPQPFGNQIAVYDGILVTATALEMVGGDRVEARPPQFWVSTDEGRTFTKHAVTDSRGVQVAPPTGSLTPNPANGVLLASDPVPWVSADPTRRGRFALMIPRDDNFEVYVTNNSGEAWTGPTLIAAPGADKPWMEFGPTGLLGVMWRTRAVDVYSVISCDGGKTFSAPLRVNHATQPHSGGGGEWSRILPYAREVYVTWADGRTGGAPEAIIGRVPTSMYECSR